MSSSASLTGGLKEDTDTVDTSEKIYCTTDLKYSLFAGRVTGIAFAIGEIDSSYYLNDTYLMGPGWFFEYTNGWIKVRSWTMQYGYHYTELDKDDCNGTQCFLGVLTCNRPIYFGVLKQDFVCAVFPIFYEPKIPLITPIASISS
jgi:hypothetical protein